MPALRLSEVSPVLASVSVLQVALGWGDGGGADMESVRDRPCCPVDGTPPTPGSRFKGTSRHLDNNQGGPQLIGTCLLKP